MMLCNSDIYHCHIKWSIPVAYGRESAREWERERGSKKKKEERGRRKEVKEEGQRTSHLVFVPRICTGPLGIISSYIINVTVIVPILL